MVGTNLNFLVINILAFDYNLDSLFVLVFWGQYWYMLFLKYKRRTFLYKNKLICFSDILTFFVVCGKTFIPFSFQPRDFIVSYLRFKSEGLFPWGFLAFMFSN